MNGAFMNQIKLDKKSDMDKGPLTIVEALTRRAAERAIASVLNPKVQVAHWR